MEYTDYNTIVDKQQIPSQHIAYVNDVILSGFKNDLFEDGKLIKNNTISKKVDPTYLNPTELFKLHMKNCDMVSKSGIVQLVESPNYSGFRHLNCCEKAKKYLNAVISFNGNSA